METVMKKPIFNEPFMDMGEIHPQSDATGTFSADVKVPDKFTALPDRIRYVVGFMFTEMRDIVVLIRKEKPEWQKGKLNGVGGKIEDGEAPVEAMVREFREETGVSTELSDWEEFAVLDAFNPGVSQQATVHFFRANNSDHAFAARSETFERVGRFVTVHAADHLSTVPNLKWLIPMALSSPSVCKLQIKEMPW